MLSDVDTCMFLHNYVIHEQYWVGVVLVSTMAKEICNWEKLHNDQYMMLLKHGNLQISPKLEGQF